MKILKKIQNQIIKKVSINNENNINKILCEDIFERKKKKKKILNNQKSEKEINKEDKMGSISDNNTNNNNELIILLEILNLNDKEDIKNKSEKISRNDLNNNLRK